MLVSDIIYSNVFIGRRVCKSLVVLLTKAFRNGQSVKMSLHAMSVQRFLTLIGVAFLVSGQSTIDNSLSSIPAGLLLQLEGRVWDYLERSVVETANCRLNARSQVQLKSEDASDVQENNLTSNQQVEAPANDEYSLGGRANQTIQQQVRIEQNRYDVENVTDEAATRDVTMQQKSVNGKRDATTSEPFPVDFNRLAAVETTGRLAEDVERAMQNRIDALLHQLNNISDEVMVLNRSWESRFAQHADSFETHVERQLLTCIQSQTEHVAIHAIEQNRTRARLEDVDEEVSRKTRQLQTLINAVKTELNELRDNCQQITNETRELQISVQENVKHTTMLVPGILS